jgi:hypothetical protein
LSYLIQHHIYDVYPFPTDRSIIQLWKALVEKEKHALQLEFIPHWQFMIRPTCMYSTMVLRMFKSQDLVLGA